MKKDDKGNEYFELDDLDELKHDDSVTVVIKVFLVVGVLFGMVIYGAVGGIHG